MKRAVVLVSGGLDSATVLAMAVREGWQCHALSVDYGQRHRAELDAAAAAEAAPAAKPPSKEEQAREVKAYDAASALFRRNDFASAAEAFRAFLKDYPQSALAPNATYWIGICQANLKDYKAALATQEGLLARFPTSPKAPDALLAIAAVQSEQGDHGSARNTLEDIIARYPGSEAAGKARTRLAAGKR